MLSKSIFLRALISQKDHNRYAKTVISKFKSVYLFSVLIIKTVLSKIKSKSFHKVKLPFNSYILHLPNLTITTYYYKVKESLRRILSWREIHPIIDIIKKKITTDYPTEHDSVLDFLIFNKSVIPNLKSLHVIYNNFKTKYFQPIILNTE